MTLTSRGILGAHDLLNCEGCDPATKEQWKDTTQAHCDNLARQMQAIRLRTAKLEDDIRIQDVIEEGERNSPPATTPAPRTPGPPNSEDSPAPFSCLTDRRHYNSRTVSKSTIDRIKASDYQRRKSMQLAKMRSISGKAWKIDWGYKIAPKIKVYTGRGKPFAPHQSVCSVQQEDSLTVFWKCCPCSEGIDATKPDSIRLKKRNALLGETVEVAWVDNCCSVRPKLQEVMPGLLVKLDCFHWCARFDPALDDVTGEKTTLFRGMMRRAVFQVEDSECYRVREFLKGKGKPHMPRDILKEAKATMPPPELLERRVMAVIHAVMEKDLETDQARTVGASGDKCAKRFFKPGAETINVIMNQLQHVRRGCLSDPCDSMLQIHRHNPVTGKTHTARGTGGNEASWRCTNRLLDAPSIGITRAEQATNNCFEADNDRKRVRRLGEAPEETSRTEQLRSLGTLAKECGFKGDDIPTTHLDYPRELDGLTEYIGLDYKLASHFNVDDVREEAEDDESEASDQDLANFLRDLDLDDTGAAPTGSAGGLDIPEDLLNEEEFQPVDVFAMDTEVDLSIFVPDIVANEKTHDSFARLTEKQPWVPFKSPRESGKFTDTDRAEEALFDEMRRNYNRFQSKLEHATGCKSFARAWNFKVMDLYKQQVEGDEVTLINRKSHKQLQDCYDLLQRNKELESLQKEDDPIMARMTTKLRAAGRLLAPHQSAVNCRPINFNIQNGTPSFGAPYALNTDVAANAFQHDPNQNNQMPILCRTLPTATTPMTRSALGKTFNAKKFCWRCGWQKTLHLRAGVSFGDHCTTNCQHEQCSKCNCRIEFHKDGRIGPHCKEDPHANSKHCEWGMAEPCQTGTI
mgnify:CR=1 FL=1